MDALRVVRRRQPKPLQVEEKAHPLALCVGEIATTGPPCQIRCLDFPVRPRKWKAPGTREGKLGVILAGYTGGDYPGEVSWEWTYS